MVNNTVVATAQTCAVHCLPGKIPNPETQVADDDVVRAVGAAGKIRQTDTVPGRGLSGNGAIGIVDGTRRLEPDEAGDPENNRARAFGFDRRAETSRNYRFAFAPVIILPVGHFNHPAAPTAHGKASVTFRRW